MGDATDEQYLLEAGIQRAEALVAAADTDEVNLIVSLDRPGRSAGIFGSSHEVNGTEWLDRMTRAGADVALSLRLLRDVTRSVRRDASRPRRPQPPPPRPGDRGGRGVRRVAAGGPDPEHR